MKVRTDMDERLKELCREVSEIIREKYNFRTEITIDGNYQAQVVFNQTSSLLYDDEEAERKSDGKVVLL